MCGSGTDWDKCAFMLEVFQRCVEKAARRGLPVVVDVHGSMETHEWAVRTIREHMVNARVLVRGCGDMGAKVISLWSELLNLETCSQN